MLVYSFTGMATPRSAQQARQIAESFVGSAISVNANICQAKRKAKSNIEAEISPYYIYNIENDKGFVIVSADDKFQDILGYCPSGSYNEEEMPDGMRYWLEMLEEEIAAAKDINIDLCKNKQKKVEEITEYAQPQMSVGPLLTTTWGQGEPFNNQIPVASNTYSNGKAATGCVATAMAQIMNYWKYPERASGSHTNKNYSDVFVYLGFVRYNWDLLPDHFGKYTDSGSATLSKYADYSEEEAEEVSKMMYHCGVTTDMKWGNASNASNTSTMYALINYFSYNKNMHAEARDVYSRKEFRDLLLEELNNGRPIPYWAKNAGGIGHYFICDGYDANTGMFHFNWGWNGSYDGYYAISALRPESPEGNESAFGTFDYQQFICVGCQPETIGEYTPMFTASYMKIDGVKYGYSATITLTHLTNSSVYYDEMLGVALIQDGVIKYSRIDSKLKLMPGDYYPTVNLKSPQLDSDIKSGEYDLCIIAKNDEGEFNIVKSKYGTPYMWKVSIDTSNSTLDISEIIREDNLPDAIYSVEMGNNTVKDIEYYSLSGSKVKNASNGIFIKKILYEDGSWKSTKVRR